MFQILKSPHVYDVAIIGSGAAGGMTAHVLTENRLDIVMLEAGPLRKPSEFPIHRMRRWNLPMLVQCDASGGWPLSSPLPWATPR